MKKTVLFAILLMAVTSMRTMRLRTKIILALVPVFMAGAGLYGQTTVFERMFPAEDGSAYNTIILDETQNGDFILLKYLTTYSGLYKDNKIVKLSSTGEIVGELDYSGSGDRVVFWGGAVSIPTKENRNNYIALALMRDPVDIDPFQSYAYTLTELRFILFDDNLEILDVKTVDMSDIVKHYCPYTCHVLLDTDGNLLLVSHAIGWDETPFHIYTKVELNPNSPQWFGDIIHHIDTSFNSWSLIQDFFPVGDGTYRMMDWHSSVGPVGYRVSSTFESDSLILLQENRFPWEDNCTVSIVGVDALTSARLNDSTIIMASPMNKYHTGGSDGTWAVGPMIMDLDYHLMKADVQDAMNFDTMERTIAMHPVVIKDDHLFLCYTRGLQTWSAFERPYTVLCKYDTDLNLIWKRWYHDPERKYLYYAYDMKATNDNGVLITGSCCEPLDFKRKMMLYALKVDADGLLSLPEAKMQVRPYCFYPNPVKEQMHMEFSPDVQPAQVELYDLQGRLVRLQRNAFEQIDISSLSVGTYLVRVTLKDGQVFSDKVVKE